MDKKQQELTNKVREAEGTLKMIEPVLSQMRQVFGAIEQVLPLPDDTSVSQESREGFLQDFLFVRAKRGLELIEKLKKETDEVAIAYRDCCGYGNETKAIILTEQAEWEVFEKNGRIFVRQSIKTELLPGDKVEVRSNRKPENSSPARVISFIRCMGSQTKTEIEIEKI